MEFSVERFAASYRKAVSDVLQFWTPEMQAETARHNIAWAEHNFNFSEYLYASGKRYEIFYQKVLSDPNITSICDVGGFFGALPLALARLGYQSTMTETLQYYSSSFDPLFSYLREEGVVILDYDPFEASAPSPGEFDVLSAMAILEHYPHSPRVFMQNLRDMSHSNTFVYLEVPNILYFPKRVSMLFGKSPLQSMETIYRSRFPFIGHHHEYSEADMRELIELSGMNQFDMMRYNYSFRGDFIRRFVSDPALTVSSFFPGAREMIAIVAKFGSPPEASPSGKESH